jgi:putative intracellular protease/amidase
LVPNERFEMSTNSSPKYSWLLFEFGIKLSYIASFLANLSGLVTGSASLRRIALPLCPLLLAILLLSWERRLRWSSQPFALCIIIGLLLHVLGDLSLADPLDVSFMTYPAFLCFFIGSLFFAAAVSMPSKQQPLTEQQVQKMSQLVAAAQYAALTGGGNSSSGNNSSSRRREGATGGAIGVGRNALLMASTTMTLSQQQYSKSDRGTSFGSKKPGLSDAKPSAVPIAPRTGLFLFITVVVLLAVYWIIGRSTFDASNSDSLNGDPRFIVTVCFSIVHVVLIWRAFARVGYQAPVISVGGLLNARNRRRSIGPNGSLAFSPSLTRSSDADDDDAFSLRDDEDKDDDDEYFGILSNAASRVKGGTVQSRVRQVIAAKKLKQQQRTQRNRARAAADMAAVEERFWQFCGAIGSVFVTFGLIALGIDRIWLADDGDRDRFETSRSASALTCVSTLLTWLGQTLLVASVPCGLEPKGTLDDPCVCPLPFAGPPLNILIVLPGDGYDVSEVAVPWYVLVRRGHRVSFATKKGRAEVLRTRHLPLPSDISIHGYASGTGCSCCSPRSTVARRSLFRCCLSSNPSIESGFSLGLGTPGPLVVAMYREMLEDTHFRRPLAWRRPDEDELQQAAHEAAERLRKKRRSLSGASDSGESTVSESDDKEESLLSRERPRKSSLQEGGVTLYATPESFDGVIIAGADIASVVGDERVWDDFDLHSLVASIRSAGKPIAAFGNGVELLARTNFGESDGSLTPIALPNRSLLAEYVITGLSAPLEWVKATLMATLSCQCRALCGLCSRKCKKSLKLSRKRGLNKSLDECVTSQSRTIAYQQGLDESVSGSNKPLIQRFLPGPNPVSLSAILTWFVSGVSRAFASPSPFSDDLAFLVEDRGVLTAQTGADAFLLVRKFLERLESSSTQW